MTSLRRSSLLLFLLAVALSALAALATPPATLRIATYNVANLFDRYDDPYTDDLVPARGTAPKSSRALYALARVIKAVNADILLLQEVENRNFLEEFNAAYLDSLKYEFIVLIEANNSHIGDRGIDVALLSRVPVHSATTFQHQRLRLPDGSYVRFSRDFLYVRLRPEGFPELHVFNLHAPSRLGGDSAAARRLAEAQLAARILRELFARNTNAWIIVGGDFNDEPHGPSLTAYTNIPGVPLRRIPAYDAQGNTATWISPGSPWQPVAFDHLLLSPAAARYLVGTHARIWNDDPRLAAEASDHRPVYLDLRRPIKTLAK